MNLMRETKARADILLEIKLSLNLVTYDLVGSIRHHGDSISSGHYTSKKVNSRPGTRIWIICCDSGQRVKNISFYVIEVN